MSGSPESGRPADARDPSGSGGALPADPSAETEVGRTFNRLSEEFVECLLRHHPVMATQAGLHDYDDKLPADTPDGYRERAAWLRDLEQRLVASVPWAELAPTPQVDFALLRSRIAGLRADLEEIRMHTRNPVLFPETALQSVYFLMSRAFAPLEERKEAILARMTAIPEYLEAARANLEQVPAIFAEIATEVSGSGVTFMEEVTHELIRAFPGEAERIEHAGGLARRGFARYQEFVRQELGPRIGGSFAIGERWMNYKLEREHMVPVDAAGLEEVGREHIAALNTHLDMEAARLDPGTNWREQIRAAKRRHPEPLRLGEAYEAEVERARRFVEQKRLAPIPAGRLELRDTPMYDRLIVPHATYEPPAPFDPDPTGSFTITPIDLSRSPEEREEQLEAHNYLALTLVVVHEAWPGHHLQRSHALAGGSRLRRIADSAVFAEGWAHYCEELMGDEGFFLDPATRLYQLKDQLWRACRVVIDAGLQTGRMTIEQAVHLLETEATLAHADAVSEVRRHVLMPTQPMSYLIGKEMLLELRAEARKRLGSRFKLHDFHAALLASGTIPVALVREEIWGRLGE